MDRRFGKNNKLSGAADYRNVFESGKRSVDRHFLVLACGNSCSVARLGLAVSAKKLARAVDRNRLKRQIRESFRKNQHTLVGLDIVVVPQKQVQVSDRRKIRESLDLHWKKVAGCEKS